MRRARLVGGAMMVGMVVMAALLGAPPVTILLLGAVAAFVAATSFLPGAAGPS